MIRIWIWTGTTSLRGRLTSARRFLVGVTHAPYQRVLDAMVADGAGLVIAGHTHGGQLCLPFYGALVTNCDLDRRRARGVSRWWPGADGAHDSAAPAEAAYLSAGLGTSTPPPQAPPIMRPVHRPTGDGQGHEHHRGELLSTMDMPTSATMASAHPQRIAPAVSTAASATSTPTNSTAAHFNSPQRPATPVHPVCPPPASCRPARLSAPRPGEVNGGFFLSAAAHDDPERFSNAPLPPSPSPKMGR